MNIIQIKSNLETMQSVVFNVKSVGDDGVIEGYGSIYGTEDQGGDIVQKGAFDESLTKDVKVKMLWQHDPSNPIGVWDELISDDKGLRVKGRITLDTIKGREAHALVKVGAMNGLSIGFKTEKAVQESRHSPRYIEKADLWEISLVTFPMNTGATITSVKNSLTKRECEKALRDAGFSRREAVTIAAKGYDAINLRDADLDDKQAILNATKRLKQLTQGD